MDETGNDIEVLCAPSQALGDLADDAFTPFQRKGERRGEYRVHARRGYAAALRGECADGRISKPMSGEMLMYGQHASIPNTKGVVLFWLETTYILL